MGKDYLTYQFSRSHPFQSTIVSDSGKLAALYCLVGKPQVPEAAAHHGAHSRWGLMPAIGLGFKGRRNDTLSHLL